MKLKKILLTLTLITLVLAMGAMNRKGFKQVTLTAGGSEWVPFSNTFDRNVPLPSVDGISDVVYTPGWVAAEVSNGTGSVSFWHYSSTESGDDYIAPSQPYSGFRVAPTDSVFILTEGMPVNFQNLGCQGAWVSSVGGGTIKLYWE